MDLNDTRNLSCGASAWVKKGGARALKAGGQGDRYTVMIGGHERYLFFEHNADYGNERVGKWFVEKRA